MDEIKKVLERHTKGKNQFCSVYAGLVRKVIANESHPLRKGVEGLDDSLIVHQPVDAWMEWIEQNDDTVFKGA